QGAPLGSDQQPQVLAVDADLHGVVHLHGPDRGVEPEGLHQPGQELLGRGGLFLDTRFGHGTLLRLAILALVARGRRRLLLLPAAPVAPAAPPAASRTTLAPAPGRPAASAAAAPLLLGARALGPDPGPDPGLAAGQAEQAALGLLEHLELGVTIVDPELVQCPFLGLLDRLRGHGHPLHHSPLLLAGSGLGERRRGPAATARRRALVLALPQ